MIRFCHYLLRPPLAQERIEVLPDGRVCCTLAHPWSDGTRALLFSPLEFFEKLAALIPRPRMNPILYHGLLAAHASGRASAVAERVADAGAANVPATPAASADAVAPDAPPPLLRVG